MAFKKIGTTFNAAANEWAEHYECDHEWEVANLPKCNPGSTVTVLDTGKKYSVGNNGLWTDVYAEPTLVELFPETTMETVATEWGIYEVWGEGEIPNLVYGQRYAVTFDGVEYECVAKFFDGAFLLGNLAIPEMGVDTGEPFLISLDPYSDELRLFTTAPGTYTFSVSGWVEEVHHMDSKYIKDMYYDKGFAKGNILPSVSVEVSDGGSFDGSAVYGPITLIAGDTYIVTFDGVEYECVARDNNGAPEIGNASIPGAGDDTGEPFLVGARRDIWMLFGTNPGEHTMSIDHLARDFKRLDEKFMPLLTSPNGTQYQITVADDGTLSAAAV